MKRYRSFILALGVFLACNGVASAEILALLNYESKPDQPVRREGIAIMDIDPESRNFGKILMEIPCRLISWRIIFSSIAIEVKPMSRHWEKAFCMW